MEHSESHRRVIKEMTSIEYFRSVFLDSMFFSYFGFDERYLNVSKIDIQYMYNIILWFIFMVNLIGILFVVILPIL